MAGIVRHKRATLLALGGMPDHVHALIRLKADLSLSDTLRALKAVSSEPNPIPGFAWQVGYAAFSVSPSREAAVRAYILNHEAHHRRSSFEEEFSKSPRALTTPVVHPIVGMDSAIRLGAVSLTPGEEPKGSHNGGILLRGTNHGEAGEAGI